MIDEDVRDGPLGVRRRHAGQQIAGLRELLIAESTDERRGVSGWARNRSDGAVEAVFEGPAEAVEAMVEFVRRGPGHADVSDVDVREEQPEGLSGFDTR